MTSTRHRARMGEAEKAIAIPRTAAAHGGALSLSRAMWRVAAARVTGGNTVRLLVDGPETFGYMLELINQAETSIDVEQYYWHHDEVGCGFCDALEAAAKRGVRVRVLVDWFGSAFKAVKRLKAVTQAGGEVRVFNPPGFRRWMGVLPRDHRKLLVVDDRVGVTGGIGIAGSIRVWADDTAVVRLDGVVVFSANPNLEARCAAGPIGCTQANGGTIFFSAPGLTHRLEFEVYQRGGWTFGLMYSGQVDVIAIPEPATVAITGIGLAACSLLWLRRRQNGR